MSPVRGVSPRTARPGARCVVVWTRIPRCLLPVRCEFLKNLPAREEPRKARCECDLGSPHLPCDGSGLNLKSAGGFVSVRHKQARGLVAPSLTALPNPTSNGGLVAARSGSSTRMPSDSLSSFSISGANLLSALHYLHIKQFINQRSGQIRSPLGFCRNHTIRSRFSRNLYGYSSAPNVSGQER